MNSEIATKANQYVADPRQAAFMAAYYDPASSTYSNGYQSALVAGYSDTTAKDLLHNRPKWLSVLPGDSKTLQPDQLLEQLSEIALNQDAAVRDKLKAIELLMKHHGMLKDRLHIDNRVLNIQSVLG